MDPDLTGTPTPEECLEILRQHLATAPPRESLSPLKRELIAKITSATQEDEALLSSMSRDFDAYLDAVNKPTESRQNAKKRS